VTAKFLQYFFKFMVNRMEPEPQFVISVTAPRGKLFPVPQHWFLSKHTVLVWNREEEEKWAICRCQLQYPLFRGIFYLEKPFIWCSIYLAVLTILCYRIVRIAALRAPEAEKWAGRRRVVVGLGLDPATAFLPATHGPESGGWSSSLAFNYWMP
jgi:hypothetical protein